MAVIDYEEGVESEHDSVTMPFLHVLPFGFLHTVV